MDLFHILVALQQWFGTIYLQKFFLGRRLVGQNIWRLVVTVIILIRCRIWFFNFVIKNRVNHVRAAKLPPWLNRWLSHRRRHLLGWLFHLTRRSLESIKWLIVQLWNTKWLFKFNWIFVTFCYLLCGICNIISPD